MTTRKIAALALLVLLAWPASLVGDAAGTVECPGAVATDPRTRMDLPEAPVRAILKRGAYPPGAQVGLIEQIERRGRVEFLPELVDLLGDDHADVQQASSRALASFGWERAGARLLALLSSKTAPVRARELAVRIVGAMGRPEAVEPLLAALEDKSVAAAAAQALGAITFQDLPDADAWRRWWTENKGRTRIEWAAARIDELKRCIDQDGKDDEAARKRAAELEDGLGAAAVKFLDARADRNDPAPLVAALDMPSLKVRRYAASELGKLKAKDAVAKLTELATGKDDATLRADCAAALGNIGAPESAESLKGLLGDADDAVAASAASALGRMKADGATDALLAALKHRSPGVRGAAAESLGHLGVASAVGPLGELLAGDADASVRERAARALGEAGDGRSRAALEKALSDDSAAVRVYAVEALGQIGVPEVAGRLGEVLEHDASPSVRESAAVALGRIGCKDALGPLLRAADGGDEKLASLAWSSVLAACRRDDALAESTADDLARAGKMERAAPLYEVLEKSLVDKKDDPRLASARVKLADGYLALKQPAKAAATLKAIDESLKGGLALPDDLRAKIDDLRRRCAPPVEQKP